MRKFFVILYILFLLILSVSSMLVDKADLFSYKLFGAIILSVGVLVFWIIIIISLLKKDDKQKNISVSDKYEDLSMDKLKDYNIDYVQFREYIFLKIQNIYRAISEFDYDELKKHLTKDLYKFYYDELSKMEVKRLKNVCGNLEFIGFKIFDIKNEYNSLCVSCYVGINMMDYIVNIDNMECNTGESNKKSKFEYEFLFMKKSDGTDYVLAKKTLVNKMNNNFEKR